MISPVGCEHNWVVVFDVDDNHSPKNWLCQSYKDLQAAVACAEELENRGTECVLLSVSGTAEFRRMKKRVAYNRRSTDKR